MNGSLNGFMFMKGEHRFVCIMMAPTGGFPSWNAGNDQQTSNLI